MQCTYCIYNLLPKLGTFFCKTISLYRDIEKIDRCGSVNLYLFLSAG